MRLTVLGRFGPFPPPGGACSGYLVESGDTRLLLDCGSGVIANLRRVCPAAGLTGVVVSHWHMDHASDLGVLRYALEAQAAARLPVVAPATPDDAASLFLGNGAFLWKPSRPECEYSFGSLTVRLFPVVHPVETYAVRVSDGVHSLFYTGDTAYFPELAKAVAGADVLLADACFAGAACAPRPVHMTAAETARLARESGAKRLLLTHLDGETEAAAATLERIVAAGIDFSPAMVVQDMGIMDI